MHGLKVGDRRVVHHKNQDTMQFDQTVVMTHCEHHEEHGRVCATVKKKVTTPRPRSQPKPVKKKQGQNKKTTKKSPKKQTKPKSQIKAKLNKKK